MGSVWGCFSGVIDAASDLVPAASDELPEDELFIGLMRIELYDHGDLFRTLMANAQSSTSRDLESQLYELP